MAEPAHLKRKREERNDDGDNPTRALGEKKQKEEDDKLDGLELHSFRGRALKVCQKLDALQADDVRALVREVVTRGRVEVNFSIAAGAPLETASKRVLCAFLQNYLKVSCLISDSTLLLL
jgi:hypothetical protein